MSVHDHSIKAYVEEKPILDQRSRAIHTFLLGKNLTDREVKNSLGFTDMNDVRPRITELIQQGWAKEVSEVLCPETGKTVRVVTALETRQEVALPTPVKKRAGLKAEVEALRERCRELEAIANDCVKALEANNPDMLPYVRFEVRAEGKAGTTRKSEASITAPELVERYCDECKVKPGELIFTKYRAGVRFHPVLRPV